MKLALRARVLLASLVLVALVSYPVEAADDCTAATFGVLATSPTVSLCMTDSNIPLLTMARAPTPDQLSVVCRTPTCRDLLRQLQELNAPECTIPLGGRLRLRADLIDPAVAYCAEADLRRGASSGSSDGSALGDAPPRNRTATTMVPSSSSISHAAHARAAHLVGALVAVVIVVSSVVA